MPDEPRWNRLVERLTGGLPADGSFGRIMAAYSESHRRYHTFSHIRHCLAEFDAVTGSFESPDEVECALWLHDMVYDTHAADNEEKSAQIAEEILHASGCPHLKIQSIRRLIMFTRHIQPPDTPDARLMVDIDLAILGQPPAIFAAYERKIRAEYSWVTAEAYRNGRTRVLRSFLDRASVYNTERFERLYGRQAGENILKALDALA